MRGYETSGGDYHRMMKRKKKMNRWLWQTGWLLLQTVAVVVLEMLQQIYQKLHDYELAGQKSNVFRSACVVTQGFG